MATTAGALSAANIGSQSVALTSAVATAGTSPYAYQWYRSETSDFVPGPANDIVGATTLTFTDTPLVPGTQYYYKVIAIDDSATPVPGTSAQLSVLTLVASQNMNQFQQSPYLGMLDLRFNYNSITVRIDDAVSGTVAAGTPMMYTQDAGGVPTVTPCTANTDIVAGFINYDIKTAGFIAGDYAEMSQRGNVMYLTAAAAIARGARVMVALNTVGGVITATTGKPVSGFAQDVAEAGDLVRIEIMAPSYELMP